MEHEHEIPGAGPTRILSRKDGDEAHVPHWVEEDLRRPQPRRPSTLSREDVLTTFLDDFTGTTDRPGCIADWIMLHPHLAGAITRIAEDVTRAETPPPEPVVVAQIPEEVGEPTPGAIAVLAMTATLVSMVLGVCRLFGTDIGVVWVLAPMWGSALALTLAGAVTTTIEWARRNSR